MQVAVKDKYEDKDLQFALQQPAARVVDSTLEDTWTAPDRGVYFTVVVSFDCQTARAWRRLSNEFAPVIMKSHSCPSTQELDGRLSLRLPMPSEAREDAPYLHTHALWTWDAERC